MKIFISGKITGEKLHEARCKFNINQLLLECKGHEVVNPFKISPYSAEKTWSNYMCDCINGLMLCDAIFMLRDWGQSRGARIEYAIAKELGLQIYFEGDFNG